MNDTIEKLKIQIDTNATKALKGLDNLSSGLNALGASVGKVNVGQLSSIATSLSELSTATATLKSNSIKTLAKNLGSLASVDTSKIQNNLSGISSLTSGFNVGGMTGFKEFASGIRSMSTATKNLDQIDYAKVAENIKRLTQAIKPLTDEMIRGGGAISSYGTQMKEFVQAAKTAESVKGSTKKGFYGQGKMSFQLFNLQSIIGIVDRIGATVGKAITNMNSYVENINLFTVAMGDYADKGRRFAEEMEFKLGIDSGEAMRQMGFFQQLQTSFGTTADKAYIVSKNLTQLGYDMASFLNLDPEEAFLKLQSGLAGKIFCLVHKGLCTVTRLKGGTPTRTIPC